MVNNNSHIKTNNFELLQEHYQVEKRLADKLRNSSAEQRKYLYNSLYDELYQKVPHHPQLYREANPGFRLLEIHKHLKFLKRFLNPNTIFLEIGPGDCALALEVSKHVKKVYAIDVSEKITQNKFQQNFELIISDGCSVSVPENSITVAYSNQLMEHLHPDDAFIQLQNIYHALASNGIYICITPNRLNGPHDVSRDFDEIATGFHLKEYTITELSNLFRQVGFSKIKQYIGAKGVYISFPIFLIKFCEFLLKIIPSSLRRLIANNLLFAILLEIRIIGIK